MSLPLLTIGHVSNHAPDVHGVYVILKSGESPVLPVQVGTHGPNDALRAHHRPLPGRGTWGLIAFPHGSAQNGIWLTSYPTNSQDAITAGPGDTAVSYDSHLSGHWRLLDQNGNFAEVFPDGSSTVIGNGGTVPQTYRHIVDSTGARIRVPFNQTDRRPATAAPMPRVFTHASGAKITVSATGEIQEFSAAGLPVQIGAMGDALYRLVDERFVALYNAHTHVAPTGGGATSAPSVPMTIGSETTSHLYAG